MTDSPSVIFLTMQTSASGSYWRLISAIAGKSYALSKPAEMLEVAGRVKEVPDWRPAPAGNIYMYNTPHIVNPAFNVPGQKLIINFRDPRDLVCNIYHWVFEHPVLNKSPEEVAAWRAKVAAAGIDKYVQDWNTMVIFASLRSIEARLAADDPAILKLSYAQICLDFDRVVEKLIAFLGVRREDVRWELVERERTSNLAQNPAWIGQIWNGTDTMPGRHRTELKPETVVALDHKFRDILKFLRSLEAPAFRHLLATAVERVEMDQVLVGREDELFLRQDADDTVAQITGTRQLSPVELFKIGLAHSTRQQFGALQGGFGYYHAVIPFKEAAHRHLLPAGLEFEQSGPRPLRAYLDAGLGAIWQPFYQPDLLAPKGGQRFFPRTDTHWNHAGALAYLQAFLVQVSPERAAALKALKLRRFASSQQGDLAGKIELPAEPVEIIVPEAPSAQTVFDNGINNEGWVVWTRNAALADGSRLLVLHDGFTNWLRPFIAELFSEVLFVHGTLFDYDFVQQFAPQTVISLQAERFFPRLPQTGGDLFATIAQAEAEKSAPRRFKAFWDAERAPPAQETPKVEGTALAPLLTEARGAAQRADWFFAGLVNDRIRELFPDARDGWLGGGRAARELGQHDKADTVLTTGLEKFPNDRELLTEYALVKQVQHKWLEAVPRWEKLAAAEPDFVAGFVGRVQCLRAAGRLDEAQADLDALREKFQDSVGLWAERGRVAFQRQDWATAVQAFEEARQRQPNNPQWVIDLIEVLHRQENDAAVDALVAVELPRFPHTPDIAIQQAQVAIWRRDVDGAVRLWGALRERYPDNVRVLVGMAEALARARAEDELLIVLDELLARAPGHPVGSQLLTTLQQRLGWDVDDRVVQVLGRQHVSPLTLFEIAQAHRARQQFGGLLGGFSYDHAILPVKEVVHRQLIPAGFGFEQFGPRPLRRYLDSGLAPLWHPFYQPQLLAPKAGQHAYPRPDPLWSHAETLAYLQALLAQVSPAKAAALKALPIYEFTATQVPDQGGDPESIEVVTPMLPRARIVFENGIKGAGRVVWCRNEAVTDGARVLVLQDSAYNGLHAFIAEVYSEAVFVQSSVFDYEFVRALAPGAVIVLQAEQQFVRRPDSGGDLLAFVAEQEAAKNAPRRLQDFWTARREQAVAPVAAAAAPAAPAAEQIEFGPLRTAAHQAKDKADWAQASLLFARMRELFAAARDGWLEGARALRQQAKYDEADALLAETLEKFPGDRDVLAERALLMQVRRNWPEAVSRWQNVTAAAPDFEGGHVGLAQCLRAGGRTDEAAAALAAVRDRFPDSLALWVERGRLAAAAKDWPAALEAFQTARRLRPKQAQWVAEVMEVLHRLDKPAAVDELAAAELPNFPGQPDIAIQEAQIAIWRHNWERAVPLWETLRARYPENVRILAGLAESLNGSKDDNRLVTVLDTLLARAPNHVLGSILYAKYEQRHGQAAASVTRLEAIAARYPHDRQVAAALADARAKAA